MLLRHAIQRANVAIAKQAKTGADKQQLRAAIETVRAPIVDRERIARRCPTIFCERTVRGPLLGAFACRARGHGGA